MSKRRPAISTLAAIAQVLVLTLGCEAYAPARPPAPVYSGETSSVRLLPTVSAAPSASGEPTCACNKEGTSDGAVEGNTLEGPVIAYNGPLSGDVAESTVEARIREAGGVPLRLTPKNQHQLENAAGLVLVGGDDINPKRYGERTHEKVRLLSPEREAFDFQLIEAASSLRLPVLGICLGAQELWVAAKGSLIQDIPTEIGAKVNHRAKEALHSITLVDGTKLSTIYGGKTLQVFSNHHQAVDAKQVVPTGFVVSAVSSDGVAEAFESDAKNPAFVLGVGWHPEKRDQERVVFERLVQQAKQHAQQSKANHAH